MIAPPVVVPYVAASHAIVVRVRTRPIRHLRISLRRTSWSPWLRHAQVARRGRVWIIRLRSSTNYAVQARACLRRICSRWSRPVFVKTVKALAPARVADVTPGHQPPLGRLPRLGFNDSAYADNHPDDFFADVHALHGSIVRRIISWSWLEPDGPTPDYTLARWRALDSFVARAQTEQLGVTFELGWAPDWARVHPVGEGLGGMARVGAFRDFVLLLAARYPSVKRFGWNEPNCCTRDSYVPTDDLAAMWRGVYSQLHAATRGADVMMGGWCPCGVAGVTQITGIREAARLERDGGRFFDTITLHIYPAMYGRLHGYELPSRPIDGNVTTADFGRVTSELDADFRRVVHWHITETGWMTPGGYHGDALDADAQARAAIAELAEASRYSDRIDSFEWFLIEDQASNTQTANIYKTGLRYADGSKKPLYDAWAAYASSSGI